MEFFNSLLVVSVLLTVGRAGALSSRAIGAGELETLLRLLGPPSERQRSDLKRATDIVLVEDGHLIYWPRTGSCLRTLPMRWGACRRRSHEHRCSPARAGAAPQLARSSDTSSSPPRSMIPSSGPSALAGLNLDPWQRDVLLSAAPRLLLNATRQSDKSTAAALKAAWTVLQGGLAVVVSPSLRQSGFLFRKLTRHLITSPRQPSGARR